MSGILAYIAVGIFVYAVGLFLFVRFASFVRRCDHEVRCMMEKKRVVHPELEKPLRPARPRPRLRAA
jgi:hypothetical protein